MMKLFSGRASERGREKAPANAAGEASGKTAGNVLDTVGLGLDVVEIARMKEILERTPSFATRVFSEEEQIYCNSKPVPAAQYAMRFAAKEAVVKALGTGFAEGIGVRDIEVRRTSKGRPYVVLSGRAREIANELGVNDLPISLSYTHSEAVACAIAITDSSQAAAERRRDPMEELVKQFKETRGMLDNLSAPDSQESPEGQK